MTNFSVKVGNNPERHFEAILFSKEDIVSDSRTVSMQITERISSAAAAFKEQIIVEEVERIVAYAMCWPAVLARKEGIVYSDKHVDWRARALKAESSLALLKNLKASIEELMNDVEDEE